MSDLSNRTAYVTGASRGIGRKIATALGDRGANVSLVARGEGLEDTASEIDDAERTLVCPTDVSDPAAVESSIERTVETFGGLDVLVNNAGIVGPTDPIEEVAYEDYRHTLKVNVGGVFLTAKHAAPHLRRSPTGAVVNLSSIAAKDPVPNRTPYNSSKMAVIGLTRTLAHELADDDVTVNAVCPGPTAGPRIENSIRTQADRLGITYEEAKERIFTGGSAQGELIDPAAVAEAVVFLAGDAARSMTGQDLNVDGGNCFC
jgi:NAD(P)-dependent dehydrogenase (short-subunit alcohol dehydrogenase family)